MPASEATLLSKINVQRACLTFHQEERRGGGQNNTQFHIAMEDAHETVIERLLAQLQNLRQNKQFM